LRQFSRRHLRPRALPRLQLKLQPGNLELGDDDVARVLRLRSRLFCGGAFLFGNSQPGVEIRGGGFGGDGAKPSRVGGGCLLLEVC
jgi:hypothetical protein